MSDLNALSFQGLEQQSLDDEGYTREMIYQLPAIKRLGTRKQWLKSNGDRAEV